MFTLLICQPCENVEARLLPTSTGGERNIGCTFNYLLQTKSQLINNSLEQHLERLNSEGMCGSLFVSMLAGIQQHRTNYKFQRSVQCPEKQKNQPWPCVFSSSCEHYLFYRFCLPKWWIQLWDIPNLLRHTALWKCTTGNHFIWIKWRTMVLSVRKKPSRICDCRGNVRKLISVRELWILFYCLLYCGSRVEDKTLYMLLRVLVSVRGEIYQLVSSMCDGVASI